MVTVAILAQGTSWAVAVTQAFLDAGSIPCMRVSTHARVVVVVPLLFVPCRCRSMFNVHFLVMSVCVRNMHMCPVAKFAGRGLPSPSGILHGSPKTTITKVAGLADLLGGVRGLVIECTRGCFNIQAFHVVSIPQHNTFPHQILGIDVW